MLVLSNGSAMVESGFSINGDMLVENLHEDSLTSQRQCYDAINAAGSLYLVNIDKSMLQYMRGARSRYQVALELKRNESAEEQRKSLEKRRASDQVKLLKAKKAKICQSAAYDTRIVDREIAELNKQLQLHDDIGKHLI